jgi:pyruvate formate lyase activating enzyme
LILSNIAALVGANWPGRLVLRIPVIENFNDSDEHIKATAVFMQQLNLFEINILPFHRLGDTKWTQLGKKYVYRDKRSTPKEKLFHMQELFLNYHIACYIDSDTPF